MQFWPRKRAKRETARVRSRKTDSAKGILDFAGYKVGMTHALFHDTVGHSRTKGEDVSIPVTVIECPPLKVFALRLYTSSHNRLVAFSQINSPDLSKELSRVLPPMKKKSAPELDKIPAEKIAEVRLLVHTIPSSTGIGKKKPDVFEVGLGGSVEEQLAAARDYLGKEISVGDVLKPGMQVDVHAVTKGKGFQGPVKRFGVSLRSHKSEKTKRGPGSLGPWNAQGKIMFRVAMAGQTGFHQRTEYNKWVLKVEDDPSRINPAGGFKHYGIVRNPCILLKGSVPGPSKRLIRLTVAMGPNRKVPKEAPELSYISVSSPQG